MGLSASQARLLSITARLSDNELHSQQIANAKVRLADQTQEASREYVNSLDAQKLVYTMYDAKGNSTQVNLTPAVMYEYSDIKNQYGISNASGQLLISTKDAVNFQNSANIDEFLTKYLDTTELSNPDYKDQLQLIDEQNTLKNNLIAENLGYEKDLIDLNNKKNEYQTQINDLIDQKTQKILDKTPLQQQYSLLQELNAIENMSRPNILDYQHWEQMDLFADSLLQSDGRIPSSFPAEEISQEDINSMKESDLSLLVEFLGQGTFTTRNGETFYTYVAGGSNPFTNSYVSEMRDNTYSPNVYKMWSSTENNKNVYNEISDILTQPENNDLKQDIIDFIYHRCEVFTYDEDLYAEADDDTNHPLNGIMNWEEKLNNAADSRTFYNLLKSVKNVCTSDPELVWNENGEDDYNSANIQYDDMQERRTQLISLCADEGLSINELEVSLSNINSQIGSIDDEINEIDEEIDDKNRDIENVDEEISNKKTQISDLNQRISDIDDAIALLLSDMPPKYKTLINQTQIEWYINLWHRLNGQSENKSVEGDNGKYYKILEDNLYKSSTWLQFALEQGLVTLEQVQRVDKAENDTGLDNTKWVSKIYTTCADIQFVDDETAIARAEAIYTRKLNEIEAKDKKYDNDIKKLDTEHNALQTEYESVKSVVDKNVERSFKAFS